MLGTFLIIAVIVCGYMQVTFWLLIPASIAAAFIGLHFPVGKADMAKSRGIYWKVLFSSLPIQGIFMSVLFGLGWGIKAVIS
ncbi:hypothetical protein [Shewanella sp. MBTL60-007]|uniref:hypothetical protein n=1 Tax=Shewanella sp. MBTL60-007 TaxID=2815911 RepID=UPI001BC7FF44|nr:hypothetical protein [Shewanella sp. MBTL60-007]GIU19505.1 hypothetical protein TUM3792_17070 [Shewanella sp. MBTL60-007]